MKDLYKLISGELKTAEYKWIDLDFGQLEKPELGLKYPCALIKISSTNKDIDEPGSQEKDILVQLRLVWDGAGNRTSADTPESIQSKSLEYYDKVALVYDLLQGNCFGNYDAFECLSEGQETRNDGLVVYGFKFKTAILTFK